MIMIMEKRDGEKNPEIVTPWKLLPPISCQVSNSVIIYTPKS